MINKFIETCIYKYRVKKMKRAKPVYLVACWAHYGIREYKWTGEYGIDPSLSLDKQKVPIVYDYYDGNGTCEKIIKIPITETTTGFIVTWTFDKDKAEALVEEYERK